MLATPPQHIIGKKKLTAFVAGGSSAWPVLGVRGMFKYREKNSSSQLKKTSLSSWDKLAQSISSGLLIVDVVLLGGGRGAGTDDAYEGGGT